MIIPDNPPTTRELEILTILQEECAEVIQAASKIKRFGWDSYYPGRPEETNLTLLEKEIADVSEMIEIMVMNNIISPDNLKQYMREKSIKLHRHSNIFEDEVV